MKAQYSTGVRVRFILRIRSDQMKTKGMGMNLLCSANSANTKHTLHYKSMELHSTSFAHLSPKMNWCLVKGVAPFFPRLWSKSEKIDFFIVSHIHLEDSKGCMIQLHFQIIVYCTTFGITLPKVVPSCSIILKICHFTFYFYDSTSDLLCAEKSYYVFINNTIGQTDVI